MKQIVFAASTLLMLAVPSCTSEPEEKGDNEEPAVLRPVEEEELVVDERVYDEDSAYSDVLEFVEEEPDFPGGEEAMTDFIQENIEYPQSAVEKGEQGIVYVQFVVNADGSIEGTKVMRGVSSELDREAIKVIEKMPAWTPGKENGDAVRCKFTLPIHFRLK